MRKFFGLIKAWSTGRYRIVPWRTILLAAVVVLYGINPFDLIPDYIPFVGVIDDLALFGFFLRSLQKDVRSYVDWERKAS